MLKDITVGNSLQKTNESQSRGSQASMSFGDSNSTMQPPIPTQETVTSTSTNPTKVRI